MFAIGTTRQGLGAEMRGTASIARAVTRAPTRLDEIGVRAEGPHKVWPSRRRDLVGVRRLILKMMSADQTSSGPTTSAPAARYASSSKDARNRLRTRSPRCSQGFSSCSTVFGVAATRRSPGFGSLGTPIRTTPPFCQASPITSDGTGWGFRDCVRDAAVIGELVGGRNAFCECCAVVNSRRDCCGVAEFRGQPQRRNATWQPTSATVSWLCREVQIIGTPEGWRTPLAACLDWDPRDAVPRSVALVAATPVARTATRAARRPARGRVSGRSCLLPYRRHGAVPRAGHRRLPRPVAEGHRSPRGTPVCREVRIREGVVLVAPRGSAARVGLPGLGHALPAASSGQPVTCDEPTSGRTPRGCRWVPGARRSAPGVCHASRIRFTGIGGWVPRSSPAEVR